MHANVPNMNEAFLKIANSNVTHTQRGFRYYDQLFLYNYIIFIIIIIIFLRQMRCVRGDYIIRKAII